MMITPRLSLVALLLVPDTTALQAQEGTFILRSTTDTIAVERFRRSRDRLESESLVRPANARLKFVAEFTSDAMVTRITNQFWLAGDSAGRPPRQTARIDFANDSAIAVISGATGEVTQRLGTKSGAIPYVNPSTALIQLIVERARRSGTTEVPMFMVAGGQTLTAKVAPIPGDSVVVTLAGGEMRFALDRNGRIRGGFIPGQNLTIEFAAASVGSMKVAKPDYAAPSGAPYTAEAVTVPTSMGHTLAGTLTVPKGASRTRPVPAVITITGSGSQDRDEAIPVFKGYQPFREFADSLGRRGIAVLRMDDRGFGESGGDAATATSADFAQDIRAGLAYLRTRPEIDGRRLALVGHSEGGLIAPMVAKDEPTLRAMVLLAGTAYTGRKVLDFQLRNGIQNDSSLTAVKRDSMLAGVPAQIDSMAAGVPWLKFFVEYDPLETARQVRTPVLILNGATDQQVTPDQVPLLEEAFKSAGNRDVTAKVFRDLNHLFVHDPDGFPGGYTKLASMKVDREVIGLVVEWLAQRFQAEPTP